MNRKSIVALLLLAFAGALCAGVAAVVVGDAELVELMEADP